MQIDKKNKFFINRIIQLLILISVGIFIYFKISQQDVSFSFNYLRQSYDKYMLIWILVVLLMPINWILEIIKWKKLCKPLGDISFRSAASGVLSGLSFSFITPHGWGDYFGRIMVLNNKDRGKLVGALFFGKMTQLFITVLAGILGIIMYVEVWPFLYIWYTVTFLLVAALLAFNKTIYKFIKPFLFRIRYFFKIIKKYSSKSIFEITGLSFLRYLVFTLQFLLIMKILEVDLSILIIVSGITWIFLVKSIIPSFNFLSDLGIREVGAVMFFENYMTDTGSVISATFIIWIINILVPAIFGSFFIFYLKTLR